nr:hypothetical protein [Tanacetum cinerariifolium]
MKMDLKTKNALWGYYRSGDDEKDRTDIFRFETPLCKAFKEFNYLSQIDVDVLIKDTHEFKAYEEYTDDWIYEWNYRIPWVNENPWNDDGVWTEPIDNICHECNPLRFKNGTANWSTCNWKEDGYCNTRDLPGFIREGNSIRYMFLGALAYC